MSRFTLDSATDFLFGSCVNSLSSGLPYPTNATVREALRESSAAEGFARAFGEAQSAISARARLAGVWPLFELFKDLTKGPMAVVNAFLSPILEDALERKRQGDEAWVAQAEMKDGEIEDGETLLDHLVKFTDGGWCMVGLFVPDFDVSSQIPPS